MAATEINIILVGKTGNGKSSTGNSLLGKSVFTADSSLNAVTKECILKKGSYKSDKALFVLTIADTPGLMDSEVRIGERLLEIQQAIEMCPSPHAFLLIFSSSNRITKDEIFTIDLLRVAFGEDVFDHCIVVFTHGSRFQTDEAFTAFWKKSEMIVELVKRCQGRITRIENEGSVDLEDNADLKQILESIETMSERGNKTYRYIWIDAHRKAILEHLENNACSGDYQKELSLLVSSIGKHVSGDKWKTALFGGALLVTVGAVGFGAVVMGKAATELAMSRTLKSTIKASVVIGMSAAGNAISTAVAKFWKKEESE